MQVLPLPLALALARLDPKSLMRKQTARKASPGAGLRAFCRPGQRTGLNVVDFDGIFNSFGRICNKR